MSQDLHTALSLPQNAHTNEDQVQRKWLLYLIGEKDPLLGFVHATTRQEALDRVAGFNLRVIAVPADAPAIDAQPMTPERIDQHFEFFHSIIPSYSSDTGHRRTSYFYRKQAIEWAKMARQSWPTLDFAGICRKLAKRYLALYRETKVTALTIRLYNGGVARLHRA